MKGNRVTLGTCVVLLADLIGEIFARSGAWAKDVEGCEGEAERGAWFARTNTSLFVGAFRDDRAKLAPRQTVYERILRLTHLVKTTIWKQR